MPIEIKSEEVDFENIQNRPSAWRGNEKFLPSIIRSFNLQNNLALDIGVDEGYSTEVFSKFFKKVQGIDSFEGDPHIGHPQGSDFFNKIKNSFKDSNVEIIKTKFEDFILNNHSFYDLIHIDIVHLYEPTFKCAEWAINHSNVVLLHDTISFPDINRVCIDISNKYNLGYININYVFGLGILYKKI